MKKTLPKLSGIASKIIKAEAHELLNVADRIDASVVKAAKIILKHEGKVVVCGVGKVVVRSPVRDSPDERRCPNRKVCRR